MSVPQAPSSTRIRSLAIRLISLGRVPPHRVPRVAAGAHGTLSPRERVGCVAFLAASAAAASLGRELRPAATGPSGAFFVLSCRFSHSAPDDPIVYPACPAHSHDHVFIGNTSTNAFSTPASLARPPRDDLQRHGRPVGLLGADALRRRQRGAAARRDDLLPAADDGARAAVPRRARDGGGELARGHPAEPGVTQWYCGVLKSSFYGPHAPHGKASTPAALAELLAAPTNLELQVNFPDCSDGKATSADHKSHMAYSRAGRCPVVAPDRGAGDLDDPPLPAGRGANVFLSSGGVFSGHADFMDAWKRSGALRARHELPRPLRRLRRRGDRGARRPPGSLREAIRVNRAVNVPPWPA